MKTTQELCIEITDAIDNYRKAVDRMHALSKEIGTANPYSGATAYEIAMLAEEKIYAQLGREHLESLREKNADT